MSASPSLWSLPPSLQISHSSSTSCFLLSPAGLGNSEISSQWDELTKGSWHWLNIYSLLWILGNSFSHLPGFFLFFSPSDSPSYLLTYLLFDCLVRLLRLLSVYRSLSLHPSPPPSPGSGSLWQIKKYLSPPVCTCLCLTVLNFPYSASLLVPLEHLQATLYHDTLKWLLYYGWFGVGICSIKCWAAHAQEV